MDHPAPRHDNWLFVTQLTTVLGLVIAVEHWGLALMVALGFMTALFAWAILATMWDVEGLTALPRILRRGLDVGLMAPAFAGLATALGDLSVLVVAALVISHPQVRAKTGTLWRGLVTFPPETCPSTEHHSDLSDAALCAVWQGSHARLRSARTADDKAEIVQLRQRYLDELHRRHPDALAAWLASGAPPDSNPQDFISRGGRRNGPPESGGP